MTFPRRRWIALAFVACWALGPALGAGLAMHELEHHGLGEVGPAGVDERVLPVLHGHFHEEGTGRHSHDAVPATATLLAVSATKQLSAVADTSQAALRSSGLSLRPPLLESAAPEPSASPPGAGSLQDLCVLRL